MFDVDSCDVLTDTAKAVSVSTSPGRPTEKTKYEHRTQPIGRADLKVVGRGSGPSGCGLIFKSSQINPSSCATNQRRGSNQLLRCSCARSKTRCRWPRPGYPLKFGLCRKSGLVGGRAFCCVWQRPQSSMGPRSAPNSNISYCSVSLTDDNRSFARVKQFIVPRCAVVLSYSLHGHIANAKWTVIRSLAALSQTHKNRRLENLRASSRSHCWKTITG